MYNQICYFGRKMSVRGPAGDHQGFEPELSGQHSQDATPVLPGVLRDTVLSLV